MPRRRSIPSRCCALRSMFGPSEARLGMATKPASSRTISASAPRRYRSTCSRDCPRDGGARSSATAAEAIARRVWTARIGPPFTPSLHLGGVDGLPQLLPGALDTGLQGLPALLAGGLDLVELLARLIVLLLRLRLHELLLVLDASLRGRLLRLGLHLLQLRAPFGELRLHPGDVGVLHLLHSHGSLPPAGRRDHTPVSSARGAPGAPICLPERAPLPQLAHAPQLLQEREQNLGLPGAVVPLAVDEEGRGAVDPAARAGEELRTDLLRHLVGVDVLRELVHVAAAQRRVAGQVLVLE